MKIKLTSVYVNDQDKALRFYMEALGFIKKGDVTNGPYRWLTVVSPDEPEGTELQLSLNDNPLPARISRRSMSTASPQPCSIPMTARLRSTAESGRTVHGSKRPAPSMDGAGLSFIPRYLVRDGPTEPLVPLAAPFLPLDNLKEASHLFSSSSTEVGERDRMAESSNLLQGTGELMVFETLSLDPMHGGGIAEWIDEMLSERGVA